MKKSKKTGSERIFDFFVYGVAILLILLIIYPLWFVIIASFSDPADVGNGNVWLWPNEWRLDGYIRLFEQSLFWRGYLISPLVMPYLEKICTVGNGWLYCLLFPCSFRAA